jgi:hypothetical protein
MESDPKPGWKTTEFWLTLAAVVIAAIGSTPLGLETEFPIVAKCLSVAMAVLAALGYTGARALVKAVGRGSPRSPTRGL